MIKIDIISDPICPWCYIGKTNLDRAMNAHPEHPFEIEWHPFQLNPDMPAEGMDRRDYLETKFGGQEGAIRVYSQIDAAAQSIGLTLDFAGIRRTPNTINAHRLIHWAGLEKVQGQVVDRLFKAYFKEGRDISERSVLRRIGEAAGMDGNMIDRLLDTVQDVEDIRERDAHARSRGVSGVPCFIVGGRYAVQGAQPPETWAQVIEDVLAAPTDDTLH
ncbi:MAG: DsbA family oxidoreductase [Pseudomonadota bacterium]